MSGTGVARLPLDLPAGLARDGTAQQSRGRWRDGNLVRWVAGSLAPVGGWTRRTAAPLPGRARGLLAWRDNAATQRIAVGTSRGLFVLSGLSVTTATPAGLPDGSAEAGVTVGFGTGYYGRETYGTPRALAGAEVAARVWSMDTWGEVLLAVPSDVGTIYRWTPGTTPAVPVPNAPICAAVAVTEERHVLAVGTGPDGRGVAWCSRENMEDWTPTPTNTAGSLTLQMGGRLIGSVPVTGGTLLLGTAEAHMLSHVGGEFVYGAQGAAEGCGLVAPRAATAVGGRAYWWGDDGFWTFDGAARRLPCEVEAFARGDADPARRGTTYAGVNALFGEVWWFYTANDGARRYVCHSYAGGWWAVGELSRLAWHMGDGTERGRPFAMGEDGHLYRHEDGWTDADVPRGARVWAETGTMQVGEGERDLMVRGVVADAATEPEGFRVSFRGRRRPQDEAPRTHGPYTFTRPDGRSPARFMAREVTMRVEGEAEAGWRLGRVRLEVVAGAAR